ncbi:uncharacterized protein TRIADDRAFT_58150 [Trichoplax adhaerens]|uniref:Carboxypeptidase n=1 Tax=Trichoplax adhaerens TaxID=10228 RepID=B3S106_TRIAD|nr:hypothetical protein TRIADDRAFT_58150 [Trichoplax adhaerens]EDV23153.1 hypothetical protein TRIADDRAFT_58150 [Trichoplax adhaerens]|eukprot:XP_002114063.1 hypothetical protein TRIADDRAFT_58150 [Trichoplax adhaerens]
MEDELLDETQHGGKVALEFVQKKRFSSKIYAAIVVFVIAVILIAVLITLFATGIIGGNKAQTPTNVTNVTINGVPGERWDYVTVRPGAHMFYMFYGSTKTTPSRDQLPLILWLQGGPGGSSTGFGNFAEIGPLDINLKPRKSTWLSRANLLFIDNPVGTGWSYVDNSSLYTTDVDQIASDLVVAIKVIFNQIPKMRKVPFYIFAESYGGKMTVAFAIQLKKAIASNSIQCNFHGVALGDSWISPYDYVNTWGPYLFALSLLDKKEEKSVQYYSSSIAQAMKNQQYQNATNLWRSAERYIELVTGNVNFYNVLSHRYRFSSKKREQSEQEKLEAYYHSRVRRSSGRTLSSVMNSDVRKMLGSIIPSNVVWGGQANQVFAYQEIDFMKPVIDRVDELLNMNVTVAVYNGQLDVICDTLGTEAWMAKLKWKNLQNFQSAKKHIMKLSNKSVAGFYKKFNNLSLFWILKAGHMVPIDAPDAALQMVDTILTF